MEDNLLDESIPSIIAHYPETRDLFVNQGFGELLESEVAGLIPLKSALQVRGLNSDLFLEQVARERSGTGFSCGEPEQVQEGDYGGLDLFASFPCPLKVPLEGALRTLLDGRHQAGRPLVSSLDGCNQLRFNDVAGEVTDLAVLPDVIVSSGINSLLSHAFRRRFIDTGAFRRWPDRAVNPRLAGLGLDDPDGFYRVIAVNLFVFAVDKSRIGSLPVPRSWAELLNPLYAGTAAMCAHGEWFNESVLVALHALYGDDGLKSLGRTVRYGMHPSQFAKHLGSGRPETPALAIVPLFFARTAKSQDDMEIVWPREGALAAPLFMLAKERSRERLADVTDFFDGAGVAHICSGAFFPALHPQAPAVGSVNAPINWFGWQYLRDNDPEELRHRTLALFTAAHRAAHGTS
ncbi:ABC transporter substrate-binding protein [Geobacter sp. FeAm09]|uniref:ABC transporter substrate-binding protein n=1 Tax=Geobacter sp. FeAm09 TaxID=2597769 RepID=UPI00143CDFED|nr:ABC transporter substrate-binding protein [Geobacter sp. FeAm09]